MWNCSRILSLSSEFQFIDAQRVKHQWPNCLICLTLRQRKGSKFVESTYELCMVASRSSRIDAVRLQQQPLITNHLELTRSTTRIDTAVMSVPCPSAVWPDSQ